MNPTTGECHQTFLSIVMPRYGQTKSCQSRAKRMRGCNSQMCTRNKRKTGPMRAVVQRVSRARVTVEGSVAGEIAGGLMILLGIGRNDTSAVAVSMAEKIANLRIFEDSQGKMNRSLLDAGGSALVVSQFTLYGDARGQRRPSFIAAAPPEQANKLYQEFSA